MSRSMANRVSWILARTRGPRVLNVGCAGYALDPRSPYWVHGRLCDSFPSVAGIDYDGKIVADLGVMGYAHVYHANAESFHLAERFDTIVAGELLEHLCNPGLFLQRVKEHLAPGGKLLLTTPYAFALVHFLYALFHFPHTCSNREHTSWFCMDTLFRLARLNGLRVTQWELREDYRVRAHAPRYRLFVGWLSLVRCLVPMRLRANTIVLELEIEIDDPARP
jgi:SAM-dependent methyltransferase